MAKRTAAMPVTGVRAGAPARLVNLTAPRWRAWLPLVLIVGGVLVYLNSLPAQFIYDDVLWIINSPEVRAPRVGDYLTPKVFQVRRPLVRLSLAVNFALDKRLTPLFSEDGELDPRSPKNGLNVEGYHLFNMAVHVAAGLALFGVARRLLRTMPERFSETAAALLALLIALIWLVHPLQTQAVTYVIQRSESMMALFYLLTLYGAIRLAEGGRRWWGVLAVGACFLGVWSKEVIVTAPLVVLLVDLAFLARPWRTAFTKRWPLYAGLVLACGTYALAGFGETMVAPNTTAGLNIPNLTPWTYLLTQAGVILHYLRLAFWPHPLVFDYVWQPLEPEISLRFLWEVLAFLHVRVSPDAQLWTVLAVQMALVGGLLAAALGALVRRPRAGCVALAFFLVLAPTSSILPIADLAVEHRMYLPLAAVVGLVVVGAYLLVRRWTQGPTVALEAEVVGAEAGGARGSRLPVAPRAVAADILAVLMAAAVVIALSLATVARNQDYATARTLWRTVKERRPFNPRAYHNFAAASADEKYSDEAREAYQQALELKPDFTDAQDSLISILLEQGELNPAYRREAMRLLDQALKDRPNEAVVHYNYGGALMGQGRLAEAIPYYEKAIALHDQWLKDCGEDPATSRPRHVRAMNNLGMCLYQLGEPEEAETHFRQAIAADPEFLDALNNLGTALKDRGEFDGAIASYQQALKVYPAHGVVLGNLGRTLVQAGRYAEARYYFERALKVAKDDPEAFSNVGLACLMQGRPDLALQYFERALKAAPRHPEFLRRLAWLRATCADASYRDVTAAVPLAEQANEATGDRLPPFLQTLAAAYAAAGKFDLALGAATRAREQAQTLHQPWRVQQIDAQLATYRRNQPLRGAMVP